MRFWRSWILLATAASVCPARTAPRPQMPLLYEMQYPMEQNLERLPNYTCLQTIERSRREKWSAGFKHADTIRLAIVAGEIPGELGVSEFLLPQRATSQMTFPSGAANLNRIE